MTRGRYAVRVGVFRQSPDTWPRNDRLIGYSDESEFLVDEGRAH